MQINKPRAYDYQNEEYFNFLTEFKVVVEKTGIDTLLPVPYKEFVKVYNDADTLLDYIRRSSPLTKQIAEADSERDSLFGGLRTVTKGMLSHYDTAKKEAATKLITLFNDYKSNKKNYAKESSSLKHFLELLQGSGEYASDIATLDLKTWVLELEKSSNNFDALILERTKQAGEKPKYNMEELRREIDSCYGDLVRCIEATTILDPDHNLTSFINTINSNVKRYNDTVAIRKGKAAAQKVKAAETTKIVSEAIIEEPIKVPEETIDIPAKK